MPPQALSLSPATIAPKVQWIREEKVILDFDLAAPYGVEARALNQAVKRNRDRFPEDFMFRLTAAEADTVRRLVLPSVATVPSESSNSSQTVMSYQKHRGYSYRPYAFTEQGVAMLSSVLRSQRAIEVNIAIMRTFVQLRRLMDSNRELGRKIESLEKKYDEQFRVVFQAIKSLIAGDRTRRSRPRREIGFHAG